MSLILLMISVVQCTEPSLAEKDGQDEDTRDKFISFDNLDIDENFEEMTIDNLQPMEANAHKYDLDGESGFHSHSFSDTEFIDEEDIEAELAQAEDRSSYPPWKVILMVGGAAVGLVVLVGATVLVLKNVKPKNATSKNKSNVKPSKVDI